jgi:hypothetical protein
VFSFGDFFAFSDPWLQDPRRTAAEAKQWEEFYRAYIKEKAESKSEAVRSAIAVGQAAFDGMSRTTRQLSEMARTGVKAASDATADAVKGSGRRKR